MMALIVLLLSAILITLLGIWKKVPGVIAGVLGFILFCLGMSYTASYIGGIWAMAIWLGAPLGALLAFGIYEVAHGRMDIWGNSIRPTEMQRHMNIKRHNQKELDKLRRLKKHTGN